MSSKVKRSPSNFKRGGGKEGRATELMRVALSLFASRDFATITIKDIARASGFDSALIYYYFHDKEDLFNQAVKFGLAESLDAKQRLRDRVDDPVHAIRDWFAHCLQAAEQNRTIFRVMLHHAGSAIGAAGLELRIEEFYASEEVEILARNIERGIKAGQFRPVDPLRLGRFVSVHLDGITAASILRRHFDMAAAFADLERNLMELLGYAAEDEAARSVSFGGSSV